MTTLFIGSAVYIWPDSPAHSQRGNGVPIVSYRGGRTQQVLSTVPAFDFFAHQRVAGKGLAPAGLTMSFSRPYHRKFDHAYPRKFVISWESSSALRAIAHRLSPCGQRTNFHLQLAVCPPEWRNDDPAAGRHRCRAEYGCLGEL